MEENDQFLKYIFHDDLYIIDEPEVVKPRVSEETISSDENEHTLVEEGRAITYLGDNEKGILILVNDPESEFLNQQDLKFLMTIVKAGLKFTKKDFALVNCAVFSEKEILKDVPYNYLIDFGINSDSIVGDNQLYQLKERENKKLIYSESLKVIEADEQKKRLLWAALKKMFEIK